MKPTILNLDTSYTENPDGTYRGARNLVSVPNKDYKKNEDGVQIFERQGIPDTPTGNRNKHKYNQVRNLGGGFYTLVQIGEIVCDRDRVVIFSLGYEQNEITPAFSEIGIIDSDGYYTTVLNDLDGSIFTVDNKLNFNPYHPITGEFNFYRGQLVVAFTDNNTLPKVANLDALLTNPPSISSPFNINDILMFPNASTISTSIQINNTGGVLESGSRYLVYQYKDDENTTTNYSAIDNPFFIFRDAVDDNPAVANFNSEGSYINVITTKSVTVSLTNVDTRYKFLIVAVISKVQGGKTLVQKILELPIYTSTLEFTYTGAEDSVDIDINEILIKRTGFGLVKKFTQIHNRLYAADTLRTGRIKYQKYANLIQIDCVSKIIEPLIDAPLKSAYNYDEKSHPHREVVAAYIHWVLKDGSISEGFHIPSFGTFTEAQINAQIAPNGLHYRDTSTLAAGEGISAKVFQVEDTCQLITKNPTGESVIRCGLWENQDDFYPDNDDKDFDSTTDYNGSPLSGVNLIGQKVRYHRMPSIEWMKNNIYDLNAKYAISELDMIGLKISNVILPAEIASLVDKWVISFAKRDYNNCTVLGQSHPIFCSDGNAGGNAYTSNGMNIYTRYTDGDLKNQLVKSVCRFYDFGIIKQNPAMSPVFIYNELFYNSTIVYRGGSTTHVNQPSNRRTLNADFTDTSVTISVYEASNPAGAGVDCRIRAVLNHFFLETNTIQGLFDNRKVEQALILSLNRDLTINAFGLNSRFDSTSGGTWDNLEAQVGKYESYLMNLMALPRNLYSSFFNQELVFSSEYVDKNTTTNTLYKGDIYLVYNSINAMGIGVDYNHLGDLGPFHGIRVAHTWICESTLNSVLRFSDSISPISKYRFKWPVSYVPNRLEDIDNTKCPLPYDFNFDYNASNTLNALFPFNPFVSSTERDLFRINRSLSLGAESNVNNWKTWLLNDYFESVRNKGALINIQGRDRNLIIHHEQALFETVSNEVMKVDNISVFIGSGDIFEILPQEIVPSIQGSYGTQHMLSCVLTPMGYAFIDANQKKINLYLGNREVVTISDALIREFCFNNLPYNTPFVLAGQVIQNLYPTVDNPYFLFGYNIAYDSKFERLIITKKAYELTVQGISDLTNQNGLWIKTVGQVPIDYNDTTYFINKSFTISYSFRDKGITCFHDYNPNRLISTRNNLLGFFNTVDTDFIRTRVYRHNYTGNKAIYYNTTIKDIDSTDSEEATPFTSYIVPCFAISKKYKNEPSFEYINVNWLTNVLNPNGALITQETFDKLLAFNSYQSTDDFDLVIFTFSQYFESNVRNIKGRWFFNRLIDLLREDITTDPSPQEPFIIDNHLNQDISPIDLNKNFYNKSPLIDKFLAIKFLYNNEINSNLQNEIQIVDVDCEVLEVPR